MIAVSRSLESSRGLGDNYYDRDVHQVLWEQKEQEDEEKSQRCP